MSADPLSPNPLVAAFEKAFYGHKTLELKVISWRQFLHGASRAGKACADDNRIELLCQLQQGYWTGEITIGEIQSKELHNAACLIEIRSAQKVFADFEEANPGSEDGKDVQGILRYDDAPNSTDHFIGFAEDTRGAPKTIKGWVYFGIDTVREISRLLTLQPEPEMHVGLTVKATATPSPNALTYKRSEGHRTTWHWDGKEVLGITDAVLVVAKARMPGSEAP